MNRKLLGNKKLLAAFGAAAAVAAGGTGAALAIGGGGGDKSLKGPAADRATAAALKITGGGTANSVERDNEKGATYEVEVRKSDGSTVDVRLDNAYKLIAVDSDSEQHDKNDGPEGNGSG